MTLRRIVKKALAIYLALLISFVTVLPKQIYANEFTPDSFFYGWLCDFIMQSNYQRTYYELYSYYKLCEISDATAKNLARLASTITGIGASFSSDVASIYNSMSLYEKGVLVDLYIQTYVQSQESPEAASMGIRTLADDGGGGSSSGGGVQRYFSVPQKDVADVLKKFDTVYNNNTSSPSGGVSAISIEAFLSSVLQPCATEHGNSGYSFSSFLATALNRPYVTWYKSVYHKSTSSEPLGYVVQEFNYVFLGSSSFSKASAGCFTSSLTTTSGSQTVNGLTSKSNYVNRAPTYSFTFYGSTSSSYWYGKMVNVTYYYIMNQDPGVTSADSGQIINNYYNTGPEYGGNVNNYYYEYNTYNSYPNTINNNYIQDDTWYNELLKLINGTPSEYVYNITINNYYINDNDNPPGGGDNPPGDGSTVNNYYTDNYYIDNYYGDLGSTDHLESMITSLSVDINNLKVDLSYDIENLGESILAEIDNKRIVECLVELKASVELAAEQVNERFEGVSFLLILIITLAFIVFALWACIQLWRLIWSHMIQVWF